MLMSMKSIDPTAMAVCVDVNDRALRFVKFNALLNGIENDRVWTLKADLVSGQCLDDFVGQESVQEEHNSNNINNLNVMDVLLHGARHKQNVGYFGYNIFPSGPFDLILANPPFIPTPSYDDDDKSGSVLGDISKRYGLFSSGGSSGEEVLESIVSMSSRLLRKDHGLLAIVSEFMNPPTVDSDVENATGNIQESLQKQQSKLLYKLCQWWEKDPSWLSLSKSSNDNHINEEACVDVAVAALARGLLFTNQAPISCHTYAARRANDQEEYSVWLRHLQSHDIECVSPGLLYIETTPLQTMTTAQPCSTGTNLSLDLEYRLVPKYQELGSIWTPYNYKALLYTWCEWVAWQSAYS
jgi:Methylase of polypeptide chain release factors